MATRDLHGSCPTRGQCRTPRSRIERHLWLLGSFRIVEQRTIQLLLLHLDMLHAQYYINFRQSQGILANSVRMNLESRLCFQSGLKSVQTWLWACWAKGDGMTWGVGALCTLLAVGSVWKRLKPSTAFVGLFPGTASPAASTHTLHYSSIC